MGKIKNILATAQHAQKLYQCIADTAMCRDLSADIRAFALLQRELAVKAEHKLPGWATANCLYTRRALEQCSSEELAEYKASFYTGALCLDLSGGLGVDAVAFSRSFERVISSDPDEDLHALFTRNAQQLGIANIQRVQCDAQLALQNLKSTADLIYVDPDRRQKEADKRLVGFRNYNPDPLELFRNFGHLGRRWLVKLSPLDDIHAIVAACSGLKRISVLSKDGEVKELLLELIPAYSGAADIETVFITREQSKSYSYTLDTKTHQRAISPAGKILEWLYEPAAALIKSAHLKNTLHNMDSLNASGTLWTSAQRGHLPGRWVKILAVLEDNSLRKISSFLKERGIRSGLVKSRDFPMGSAQARAFLGISEGEKYAIYLTRSGKNSLMVLGEISRENAGIA